jgi:hypothetical protein
MNAGCDDKIALAALAGVTLLIGGVETTHAGTVTETQSFSIGPTSNSSADALSFDMFNPSLGTLTGVEFILTSATTSSVTINVSERESPTNGGSAASSATFKVLVESPSLTLFETTNSASTSCSASFNTCTNTGSNGPVTFDGTASVPAADVAEFVGSGSITVDLQYLNDFSVTGCAFVEACGASASLTWADAPGTLEVEYLTAGGVPEPSTWVLFGTGFLSFAGFSRWRGRKDAPGRRSGFSLGAAHPNGVA